MGKKDEKIKDLVDKYEDLKDLNHKMKKEIKRLIKNNPTE